MSERLQRFPPGIRFAVCVAGLLLAFFAALAAGAGAAVVVGWQQGPAAIGAGPDDPRPSKDAAAVNTVPDGTASADDEREATDPKDPVSDSPDAVASFVHRATDQNSRGDYTYLSDPGIDGDPDALVFVEPAPEEGTAADGAYDHNIGVWFEPQKRKWAVFNQDIAPVPAGTAFRVTVLRGPEAFVHRFTAPNDTSTAGASAGDAFQVNETYLDDPLVNDKPDARLSVTQNWNPGGGRGVYNDHPVGVRYDEGRGRWAIFNQDLAPFKDGAAFNVGVAEPGTGS